MAKSERKFGDIPDWAKKGPIDPRNYAYRAELHCYNLSEVRKGAHPTISKQRPEFIEWWEYFVWLGRIPAAFQILLDEPHSQREYTVPESSPQWFDTRFVPTQGWRPPFEPWEEGKTEREKEAYITKMKRQLTDLGFKFGVAHRTVETPDRLMEKYQISRAEWNALPDLPINHEDKAASRQDRR